MTQHLIPIGILVVFIGFALVLIGAMSQAQKGDSKTKVAVGGFIGLIPFGFGNDKNLVLGVMALSALIAVVWFILNVQIGSR